MQKISFLLIGTSLSFIPTITFAQCVATQDCATLGYTETSCNGGKGVKCPFGNKWACIKSDSECEQQFCDKYGFQYTCSGTGYSGGVGTACNDKYQSCTCAPGYEWKDSACIGISGAQGELYYCNGKVVGVRATGMNFYVGLTDLGKMQLSSVFSQCSSYVFCGNFKGTLPTKDQLVTIYKNKSRVNTLLSTNGGTQLTESAYWSSTPDSSAYYYIVRMSNGEVSHGYSYTNGYVLPVLTSY